VQIVAANTEMLLYWWMKLIHSYVTICFLLYQSSLWLQNINKHLFTVPRSRDFYYCYDVVYKVVTSDVCKI